MNIFCAPILTFAILLVLRTGNVAARVRGGLGEQYPAEVNQNKPSNHGNNEARKLDAAGRGKTGRPSANAEAERELWWGGGHGWNNNGNCWGGCTRSITGATNGSKFGKKAPMRSWN